MPSINDRIGSQNVIRVLSNAAAAPTRLLNLSDVNSTLRTRDGLILVWDTDTEKFYLTDTIDSGTLNVTGIVTFSNTSTSTAPTNGALVINGGIGIGKQVFIGDTLSVAGISTFASNVDINAAVDILNGLTVNSTFKSVGITTLASAGGITTTGGHLYVDDNLYVGSNLEVVGTSNFIGNATFRGGTIGIGDSSTDDIDVGGEFVSNLVPNTDNTFDIGITTQRWRDGKFSGLVTTTNLFVSGVSTFLGDKNVTGNLFVTGVSTFLGDKNVTGNLRITGFASVTEGLYYDSNDYDGPNGIAYFDNTGKLIGAASTENAITETYYILTTNAVGIPTWTSVIDGGSY
jgi:hypothetical protein